MLATTLLQKTHDFLTGEKLDAWDCFLVSDGYTDLGWGKDRKEYFEKNIWGLVRDNILLCMIISMEINIFVDLGLN